MDSGKYNVRIQFWHTETSQTSSGAIMPDAMVMDLETWANYKQPDAIANGRANDAGELVLSTFVKFRIRKRESFTPTKANYIIFRNNRYTIHQISDANDASGQPNDISIYASMMNNNG